MTFLLKACCSGRWGILLTGWAAFTSSMSLRVLHPKRYRAETLSLNFWALTGICWNSGLNLMVYALHWNWTRFTWNPKSVYRYNDRPDSAIEIAASSFNNLSDLEKVCIFKTAFLNYLFLINSSQKFYSWMLSIVNMGKATWFRTFTV